MSGKTQDTQGLERAGIGMDFFGVLTMIGGLALFLYGMNVMGAGLSKASGGRMERILERLTDSTVKGVLLGAAVTAVIQSSSATTVMVVGFVNSGIMKLSQAIGVIMGANIGTTVTSWILGLAGVESDAFFIRLLKPTSFSPVLAIVGVAMMMFAKREKKKDIGMILIGFAVLMFGMDTMSGAVKPLADVPEFTNLLVVFSNPLLGILAGALLTAVIQSSSASVGILQALCLTGSVTYATAIPIILGQNIGTCVTALLSGIGANRNAKRASLVHLYFNIIGVLSFVIIFYTLQAFFHFAFLNDAATPWGIAIIHSIFNVAATLVLLPFAKILKKLACASVKDGDGQEQTTPEHVRFLEERFLDTPSLAVEQCRNAAIQMSELTKKVLQGAVALVGAYEEEAAQKVAALEEQVDRYEDEIGTYLVKLAAKDLSERDSRTVSELLHCIGDFERISDHAVNIADAARKMRRKDMDFSKKAAEELAVYTEAVFEVVDVSFQAFATGQRDLAQGVEPIEEVIDELHKEINRRHMKRLRKGKCTIEMGFILSDITTSYERISDHCSNIAITMLQIEEDVFDAHEYILSMRNKNKEEFEREVFYLRDRFMLP